MLCSKLQFYANNKAQTFGLSEKRQRRFIIVGVNRASVAFARTVQKDITSHFKFCYFVDDRAHERLNDIQQNEVLSGLNRLPEIVQNDKIDTVFIALPLVENPRIHRLLEILINTTASVYLLPSINLSLLVNPKLLNIYGHPAIAVCEAPAVGGAGLLKYCIDILSASLLLVLLLPLMLFVSILIKCTSPGPIIFKQKRWGLNGEPIIVYKFRTMQACEDGDNIQQAVRNDPRVTRIGKFLRKASIDELPQLINVLQGRMSLVGPRPHANAHNKLYRELVSGYMLRHKVKPGITGWAQIHGARGETDTLEKMQRRIAYDIEYLQNWSIWLDLKIILQTPFALLRIKDVF